MINWSLTGPSRFILAKLGVKIFHTLETSNTLEMPVSTVPLHFHRCILTKEILRGFTKVCVVGEKGPSDLRLLQQQTMWNSGSIKWGGKREN